MKSPISKGGINIFSKKNSNDAGHVIIKAICDTTPNLEVQRDCFHRGMAPDLIRHIAAAYASQPPSNSTPVY